MQITVNNIYQIFFIYWIFLIYCMLKLSSLISNYKYKIEFQRYYKKYLYSIITIFMTILAVTEYFIRRSDIDNPSIITGIRFSVTSIMVLSATLFQAIKFIYFDQQKLYRKYTSQTPGEHKTKENSTDKKIILNKE